MACPAYAERTIIEIGLEQLVTATCLRTARTSGLVQIPVYEVFEGPALQINFQDRNRASGVLAPDFAAIGAATRTLAGQIYIYGSGIANMPPSWFNLVRACGFVETRYSGVVMDAAEIVVVDAVEVGTGGAMSDGTYNYGYTVLYEATDGLTPATTEAAAVVECQLEIIADDAVLSGGDALQSVAFGGVTPFPASIIKRLYRKLSTETVYHFVAQFTTTTYTDIAADANLGQEAPTDIVGVNLNSSVLIPAHDFDDFDALTIHGQLVELFKKPMTGTRGTMDFEAADGGNYIGRFNLTGVYGTNLAPDANPSFLADPGLPPQFCGAEFSIFPEGENERIPKVRAWGCTLGRTPGARYDGNAACANAGLREYVIGRKPDARWTCTIEEDATWDWEAEARASQKYALRLVAGTTALQRVIFENYDAGLPSAWAAPTVWLAQLIEAPSAGPTGDDGIRSLN